MILLSLALALLAGLLVLPTISDLLSVLRITLRPKGRTAAVPSKPPRFLVLVPAHNEELLLLNCLRSIARLRYPQNHVTVTVVADNCTDRTADIARAAGVECLVRTAPDQPGKPRAIAWALSQLSVSEYDGVVIIDADAEVDPDFATHLAAAAPFADKALQPYNGVANRADTAVTRMAGVLSEANHGIAYVLKDRAGLNVPLSAGMCIGSRVLSAHGWTVSSLCEDWELYALLTEQGVSIEGVPKARIHAQEAPTLKASASQRRRWTAGKVAVLWHHTWPLVRSRRAGMAQKLDSIAELSAPGPVLHLAVVALAAIVALVLDPPGSRGLAVVLLATLLRPAAYAGASLLRDPEPARAIRAFASLPWYAAWRIWAAATALGMLRDAPWVRTARHARSQADRTSI